MSTTNYDSRTADKFVVRLPEGLRDQIDAAAITGVRSMNSVIVQAVKQYLDAQNRQELLLNALASAVSVDKVRVNQISETDESVNPPINTPVVSRARSLIASLVATGDMGINEARQFLNALASTARNPEDSSAVAQSMHIDDRVKMAANARRYEWLRARPLNNEDEVWIQLARDNSVCPDRWALGGNDPEGCDAAIDRAMRLAPIEGLQPCAD